MVATGCTAIRSLIKDVFVLISHHLGPSPKQVSQRKMSTRVDANIPDQKTNKSEIRLTSTSSHMLTSLCNQQFVSKTGVIKTLRQDDSISKWTCEMLFLSQTSRCLHLLLPVGPISSGIQLPPPFFGVAGQFRCLLASLCPRTAGFKGKKKKLTFPTWETGCLRSLACQSPWQPFCPNPS